MSQQLDIFEQNKKSNYQKYYDSFYSGVKERFQKEREEKEKKKGMTISIVHGEIPIQKMLNIIPKK